MKLAELCNSSTSYIGQIEIGNKFPSIDMIEKVAQALHVKPHLLFFDELDMGDEDAPSPRREYVMPDTVKNELLRLTTDIRRVIKSQ